MFGNKGLQEFDIRGGPWVFSEGSVALLPNSGGCLSCVRAMSLIIAVSEGNVALSSDSGGVVRCMHALSRVAVDVAGADVAVLI